MQQPHFFISGVPLTHSDNQHRGGQQAPEVLLPPRVQKAMQFVDMMTRKTQTGAAVSESMIELIDGQKLQDEEGAALATACNLLNEYFAGKLQPDVWELLAIEKDNKPPQRRVMIFCISCGRGPADPACQICHGAGNIYVTPATD